MAHELSVLGVSGVQWSGSTAKNIGFFLPFFSDRCPVMFMLRMLFFIKKRSLWIDMSVFLVTWCQNDKVFFWQSILKQLEQDLETCFWYNYCHHLLRSNLSEASGMFALLRWVRICHSTKRSHLDTGKCHILWLCGAIRRLGWWAKTRQFFGWFWKLPPFWGRNLSCNLWGFLQLPLKQLNMTEGFFVR